MALTKTEIEALINKNLESGSIIKASKHRDVELAILNYIDSSNKILLTGTVVVGDIAADKLVDISFNSVGTIDYIVTGSLVSKSTSYAVDNDVMWVVREKTAIGFKISIGEVTRDGQDLDFDYVLIRK